MIHTLTQQDLREIAMIAEKLPNPNGTGDPADNLYLSGALRVMHVDGYCVGKFMVEEDWWLFVPEAGEDTDD